MNFPPAPLSRNPSSTISTSFCLLLESFIGKFIELLSTRATKQLAIDKMLGDTDAETVLLFKNPVLRLYRSSLLPRLARQIALLFTFCQSLEKCVNLLDSFLLV